MNLGPHDVLRLKPEDFQRPWPKWAKLAAARFVHGLLPRFTANHWMRCFQGGDAFDALSTVFEDGWIWGRLTRYCSEIRQRQPEQYAMLSQSTWIREFDFTDGKVHVEHGNGLEGMIAHRMNEALQLPTSDQVKFWKAFTRGFERAMFTRPQDSKAGRIYLFLLMAWPIAEHCSSIRELYDLVFRCIPPEPCPAGVDPIDFEDRQIKWFEKLCHRNLGLSLAKRGRPRQGKKNPPIY